MTDQQSSDGESNPKHPPIVPLVPWLVYQMKRKCDERRAQREKENSQERSSRIIATATAWIAILAVVAALVGISQAIIANRQLTAMKGQLNAMEADQRPWLKVEVSAGDLRSYIAGADSAYPGLIFSPHFKATNVGKSPAFNAQLSFLGYPISKDHSDPYWGQKESCERIQKMPLDNPGRGHVLFPGDFFDEGLGLGGYVVAFIGPKWRQYLTEEKDGSQSIVFYVIGCADYVFGDPLQHHQTGFVYEVYHRTVTNTGQKTFSNRFIIGQSFDKEEIMLVPIPSSSLAY